MDRISNLICVKVVIPLIPLISLGVLPRVAHGDGNCCQFLFPRTCENVAGPGDCGAGGTFEEGEECCAVFGLCGVKGAACAVEIVEQGWDLFETTSPTTFLGFDFEGVVVGTFDFGGTIGVQNVGTSDTIVQRKEPAVVPDEPLPDTADPIQIELVALQLTSASPIDVGAGLDFHFITLQPDTPSTGEMTITFDNADGGTFSSFIDVAFDLRIGSLGGPILFSDVLQLSANEVPWGRSAPPDALLVDGANHLLNGVDNAADFWLAAEADQFTESHPSGAMHSVGPATPPSGGGGSVPTMSEWGLIVLTLLLLTAGTIILARRRRPTLA